MGTELKRKDLKPGTLFRYNPDGMVWWVPEPGKEPPQGAWTSDGPHPSDLKRVVTLVETDPPAPKSILTTDKKARKEMPIARGVVDYFPRALAAVANVSFKANEQHNPGEPMHWDKSKSTDHADCIARHLIERGGLDNDGLRHSAKLAWRALALLETELEALETK